MRKYIGGLLFFGGLITIMGTDAPDANRPLFGIITVGIFGLISMYAGIQFLQAKPVAARRPR